MSVWGNVHGLAVGSEVLRPGVASLLEVEEVRKPLGWNQPELKERPELSDAGAVEPHRVRLDELAAKEGGGALRVVPWE